MNFLKRTFLLALSIGFFYSCGDDFLEEQPSEFVSQDQVEVAAETRPQILDGSLLGLYTTMYTTGSAGTGTDDTALRHYDFGQKSYDIFSDMLSGDLVLSGLTYGWYSGLAELTDPIDNTQEENRHPWRYYYRLIFGANGVIDGFGGTDSVPETVEGRHSMGQAKALRAHAYLQLAHLYGNGFTDMSAELIPVYSQVETVNQPLSTAQEVYDLIVSDLQSAVELLEGYERPAKFRVDKPVAEVLLAWTYISANQNLTEAISLLDSAIASSGPMLSASEVTNGFNDVNTPGWMWGVDLTIDNGLDLVSWWGQMDVFTYSYAWAGDYKTIDFDLYDQISDDDARKDQFQYLYGDDRLYPTGKFYDPARTIGGQREVTTDYLYMRVEEAYLLKAEAQAKAGQDGPARETLRELLSNRMDDTSYLDGLSGQALIDEIYLQTRIELWGEGKTYFALVRNMESSKRGPNHLFLADTTIPYDDDRLSFDIPQEEVQNNPFID